MDSDHARELLARERARIEHALADLRQEMASEEERDPFEPSEVGRDLFDKELGEGLAERLREQLEAVERAERRLAEGTYGLRAVNLACARWGPTHRHYRGAENRANEP